MCVLTQGWLANILFRIPTSTYISEVGFVVLVLKLR